MSAKTDELVQDGLIQGLVDLDYSVEEATDIVDSKKYKLVSLPDKQQTLESLMFVSKKIPTETILNNMYSQYSDKSKRKAMYEEAIQLAKDKMKQDIWAVSGRYLDGFEELLEALKEAKLFDWVSVPNGYAYGNDARTCVHTKYKTYGLLIYPDKIKSFKRG